MQIGTTQNFKDLAIKIQLVQEEILHPLSRADRVHNEQDFEKLEHEVQALVRRLGDLIIAQNTGSIKPMIYESRDSTSWCCLMPV